MGQNIIQQAPQSEVYVSAAKSPVSKPIYVYDIYTSKAGLLLAGFLAGWFGLLVTTVVYEYVT